MKTPWRGVRSTGSPQPDSSAPFSPTSGPRREVTYLYRRPPHDRQTGSSFVRAPPMPTTIVYCVLRTHSRRLSPLGIALTRRCHQQGRAIPSVSRSPFDPIDRPEDAWLQESTTRILRAREAGALFKFAQKYGISQTRLATATGISQARINDLIKGRRGNITTLDAWERIANGLNMPDKARNLLSVWTCRR